MHVDGKNFRVHFRDDKSGWAGWAISQSCKKSRHGLRLIDLYLQPHTELLGHMSYTYLGQLNFQLFAFTTIIGITNYVDKDFGFF